MGSPFPFQQAVISTPYETIGGSICCTLVNHGRNAMNKILAVTFMAASLAACTATERGAGIGAATGAVVGGVATGNVRGAAVGAAVGGVGGALIGSVQDQPGRCYYRDRYGNRYIDSCR
jgi:hypothetical protein